MSLPSEQELKKAWLKDHFASWEYHEEMLKLHEQFLRIIKHALARPEVKRDYPELFTFFTNVAIPNFEQCPKPGEIKKYEWDPGKTTGWARPVHDYNGALLDDDHWEWMTEDERQALWKVWMPMDQMSQNVIYTVDDMWFYEDDGNDDSLLDEEYTGPIDWPADWKEEILTELGLKEAIKPLRALPGEPCPEDGYWSIWHSPRSRRRFKKGEIMPDYKASQGTAIWSYDIDQTDRTE